MRDQLARIEHRIAAIAADQHGVITVWQLRELGIDKHGVRRRVISGRLHRVFRGVYAVGHPAIGPLGTWKAATLALRGTVVLSHACAAMLWEMLATEHRIPRVTVLARGGRADRQGLIVHRARTLRPDEITIHRGIPLTTPRRTLEDMTGVEPAWLVRKAKRQAEYLGLPLDGIETDGTRGTLERDYLDFFEQIEIPRPLVNARIGRFNVDFSWPGELFALETDAWTGHRGPEQMETDAALGLELAEHGYELVRLTGRQLKENRAQVTAFLRLRLSASAGRR